jgi:hypothetical protein
MIIYDVITQRYLIFRDEEETTPIAWAWSYALALEIASIIYDVEEQEIVREALIGYSPGTFPEMEFPMVEMELEAN